jgi:hypothetical protein
VKGRSENKYRQTEEAEKLFFYEVLSKLSLKLTFHRGVII